MPREGASPEQPPTFERHLECLEKVVADLEGDALSLEASIARYQEGVGHLAACRKILDAAEQRLAELVAAADGTVEEKPLSVGPEGLVDAGPPSGSAAKAKSKKKPGGRDDASDLPF